jgi:hypothetical protein
VSRKKSKIRLLTNRIKNMTLSNKNYGFSESLISAVKKVHANTMESSNPHIEDYTAEELADMIEKYEGFDKVKGELAHKGAKNPAALAAWIGERKYGKKKFEKAAHKGKSMRNEQAIIEAAKPEHKKGKDGKCVADCPACKKVEESTQINEENTAKLSFGKDWEMHKLHGSPVHHAQQASKHKDAWEGLLGKIKSSRDVKAAEDHMCSVLHDYDKAHAAGAEYRKAFAEHPLTKKFYDHRNWEAMHRAYSPSVTHRDVAENVEELELAPIEEALKHKKGKDGKCVKDCPACAAMKESFDAVIDSLQIEESQKAAIKSHEKKEVQDFDKIAKTVNALKTMHSPAALKKIEEDSKHKLGDMVQVDDSTSRFHGKVGQVTYAADHGAVVDFKDGGSYQPSFRHADLKGVTEEVAEAVNPGLTASIRQSTNLRQGHPQKVVGIKNNKPKTTGTWAVTEGKLDTLKVMLGKKDALEAADKDVTKAATPVGTNEEVDLEEGRGRPRKNPAPEGEEGHEPDQHIVMQLHKSISNKKPVTFADGKSHHIAGEHATKFLRKYIGSKPAARAALQDHASKSHEHFMDSIKD